MFNYLQWDRSCRSEGSVTRLRRELETLSRRMVLLDWLLLTLLAGGESLGELLGELLGEGLGGRAS